MLVDHWSGGDPSKAGSAYAVNVIGCILGPLVSGFLLLPLMNERWVTLLFALPWFTVGLLSGFSAARRRTTLILGRAALAVFALAGAVFSSSFEDILPHREVRRDYVATVVAAGAGGLRKGLFVNGVNMTMLTPVTKMMAHLPLTLLDHQPRSALVICFGMGTSYRSLMSWSIPTTAAELVPSVPALFGYYHSDGPELLKSPLSHLVIDDGRRYLERTNEKFDVILIDPPPPVEAAGSSLLYSEEFYEAAKDRLQPGGILQQWLPSGDAYLRASVTRALTHSFPYVRIFGSMEGWGNHFLASTHPIPTRTAAEMALRLPPQAKKDLLEWGPQATAEEQFASVLDKEIPPERLVSESPGAPALRDDRPVNEYYILRSAFSGPGPWPKWPKRP
jgi:spermidine synthase